MSPEEKTPHLHVNCNQLSTEKLYNIISLSSSLSPSLPLSSLINQGEGISPSASYRLQILVLKLSSSASPTLHTISAVSLINNLIRIERRMTGRDVNSLRDFNSSSSVAGSGFFC
jgi:hypothetical protein